MFAEEWPLMMFTLLSQLAIGTFIVLMIVRSLLGDKSTAAKLTNFGLKAVGPIMALALLLSFFHLGTPTGAFRSILNLGSSWLSREIFTAGGFFVLWGLTVYTLKKEGAGNGIGWLAVLAGVAAIFSMASIYNSSIRPAWANTHTFIAFFGATFVLGYAGAVAMIGHIMKGQNIPSEGMASLKKAGYLAIAAAIIPLVYLPVYLGSLNGGGEAAQASGQLLTNSYLFPLILRWVLSLAGVFMFVNLVNKQSKGARMLPAGAVLISLALVLVGEFIGRYVFYASGISIMVG
ncbi:MAG: dimethyl sulfoxide reductase anchor subunit [Desulfitobacterium hafniense]|nr:dimethyl sulfoxide reductase anchor subunit [Desulfitobacterium hafniense]